MSKLRKDIHVQTPKHAACFIWPFLIVHSWMIMDQLAKICLSSSNFRAKTRTKQKHVVAIAL